MKSIKTEQVEGKRTDFVLQQSEDRPIPEISIADAEILATLELINGQQLEAELIELASIGGEPIEPRPELPTRYAVSRLALTQPELEARRHLTEIFQSLNLKITQHPLGIIAELEGTQPELPAVGMISHFDSVPDGDMYDGTTGIIGAIAVIKALRAKNLQPTRSIKILAITGEESARFNIALFGSRGLFQGLTNEELLMEDDDGISIAQAVADIGFDPNDLKKPVFTKEEFYAMVELHVAQDDRYPDALAVIEAIAAPIRYKAAIGVNELEPYELQTEDRIFYVEVTGRSDHSGSTPMGPEHRLDALLLSAPLIHEILWIDDSIMIGDLKIHGQAMNKVPGKVTLPVCVKGGDPGIVQQVKAYLATKSAELQEKHGREIVQSSELSIEQAKTQRTFYEHRKFAERLRSLATMVEQINLRANACRDSQCVGTVTTYSSKNSLLKVGIDLRGIDKHVRGKMITQAKRLSTRIINNVEKHKKWSRIEWGEPLPGSGDPESMDLRLVSLAERLAKRFNIAPVVRTFSPAGHDIQNVSRADIPSFMIHCPSRNGGLSHNPDAYSTPLDLEWGTKLLAATIIQLAFK